MRDVHCAEAIGWLRAHGPLPGTSVVTSLPDVSEVNLSLLAWRAWFLDAVRVVIDSIAPDHPAVFFQSDIKREGAWVDKGALVVRAAEDAGARVLAHKIVCRRPPGTLTFGRPGYTHVVMVARTASCPDVLTVPDVIADAGRQPWVRAMGVRAAAQGVRLAQAIAPGSTVLDPFCGVGTVLAAANALGHAAIGVELSAKRCERARRLVIPAAELSAEPK